MRRLLWLSPLLLVAAIGSFFIHRPAASAPKSDAAAPPPAVLPLRTAVLFSSGVGYFQRRGEIDGNTRVDLTFQVRDINDLIKSMVVQDDKGQVGAISYDSLDPVDRTLKSFAVNLTDNPSFRQILNQMRGEKVEVVQQQTAVNQPGTVTGSVMGVEQQRLPAKDTVVETDVLNMWCAEGVRAVKLSEIQRLRFVNPAIESEFRRALDTLALSHDAQKKAVTLNFSGEGKREVKVGYVVENPIWKTSYRLVLDKDGKPFLQGWAVVDNPTDEDWNNVGMALISGRPISFQMDLYQPLYVPRPKVEPELFASLRSVAHDRSLRTGKEQFMLGALNDTDELKPPLKVNEPMQDSNIATNGGPGKLDLKGKNNSFNMAIPPFGFPSPVTTEELQKRMDLERGIQSAATASQLGDFFQYVINQPVTLPRQKSALLPIVNKEVEATRLSIFNPAVHAKFPMLGLKLKNTSGLHLMQGPITVFEGSTYAGDARIQDVPPKDERLISYAVDLGTEVEAKSHVPPQRLVSVRIERGIIIRTDKLREEKTYIATNRTGQERTLWIEHPYRAEFTLVSTEKPVERTQEVLRFEMKLPAEARKSVSQTVIEERDIATSIEISNIDDETIKFFMSNATVTSAVKKALQSAVELKAKLAAVSQELRHVNEQLKVISEDQVRLRANLREMPATAAAYKRYLDKFDKQETEIEKLQEQQKKLQAEELKQQKEVERYLANLQVG
jgi:hypothetical protein